MKNESVIFFFCSFIQLSSTEARKKKVIMDTCMFWNLYATHVQSG